MEAELRELQEAARLLHDKGIIGPNEYRKVLDRTKDWYELQEAQPEQNIDSERYAPWLRLS